MGDVANSGLFGEAIIWDNSTRESNRRVYGRYLAALEAANEYIYTQDDDCMVDIEKLCAEYQPAELLCNMTHSHQECYEKRCPGIALVGWGAIFPKSMVDFSRYLARYPEDELFDRECDRIFTWLNREKTRIVNFEVANLPHAHAKDRMGTEARHGNDLFEMARRLQAV